MHMEMLRTEWGWVEMGKTTGLRFGTYPYVAYVVTYEGFRVEDRVTVLYRETTVEIDLQMGTYQGGVEDWQRLNHIREAILITISGRS